jgi:hypothetical protein
MSDTTFPLISNRTRVRTLQEDPANADSWTEVARQRRRWGVEGEVIDQTNERLDVDERLNERLNDERWNRGFGSIA